MQAFQALQAIAALPSLFLWDLYPTPAAEITNGYLIQASQQTSLQS